MKIINHKTGCFLANSGACKHVLVMYFIIGYFLHYGKMPELFRNTSGTKTEKLKNCFFQRDPGRDSPYGFSFSVFQFPELFRNISGETEKLNFPGTFRQRFSIWIQFFSFSVLVRELFEKLKNWMLISK